MWGNKGKPRGAKRRFNAWRKAKGNASFGHYSVLLRRVKNMKARIERHKEIIQYYLKFLLSEISTK